jgi:hypothetical protein
MSTPRVHYTHTDLVIAYAEWSSAPHAYSTAETPDPLESRRHSVRLQKWESYCDVRDGLPQGTTQQRRLSSHGNLRLVSSRAII